MAHQHSLGLQQQLHSIQTCTVQAALATLLSCQNNQALMPSTHQLAVA